MFSRKLWICFLCVYIIVVWQVYFGRAQRRAASQPTTPSDPSTSPDLSAFPGLSALFAPGTNPWLQILMMQRNMMMMSPFFRWGWGDDFFDD